MPAATTNPHVFRTYSCGRKNCSSYLTDSLLWYQTVLKYTRSPTIIYVYCSKWRPVNTPIYIIDTHCTRLT